MPNTPYQIDYTNKDYEGFRNMMINAIPQFTPEWTDTSESDFGIVLIELLAHGLDILSYYQDRALNEAFLPTAQLRRSVINLCKLVGYTLRNATPAKVYVVFTLSSPAPAGGFPIFAGTKVSTQPTTTEDPIIFETDTTLIIPAGAYGNEKDANGNYLYQVSATQGETITEVLGSSNGQPDQSFVLKYSPVIDDDSLKILVRNSAGTYQQWTRVTDFLNSQPTDQVYTVDINENGDATITFGSGSSGAIPDVGLDNITATYRIGGGSQGNVGANTLTNIVSAVAGIASVTNPAGPYQLGQDMEDINHAKQMAPVLFRTNGRAVTLQDFSDLVKTQFSNNPSTPIIKANAVPVQNSWDWDVNLYCTRSDLAPLSSSDISAIRSYLDTVRIISTTINIQTGILVPLTISVLVTLKDNYVQSVIKNLVQQAIMNYVQTSNFDYGQPFLISNLVAIIMKIDGVLNVQVLSPTSDVQVNFDSIIQTLQPNQLTVNVQGGVVG